MIRQSTGTVLMVRPAAFGWNPETAQSNAFQFSEGSTEGALTEFDLTVEALRSAGVEVIVFQDSDDVKRPDAVFPNNWLSTHEDGSIVTYPMASPVRRLERRQEVFDLLRSRFKVTCSIDLSQNEVNGRFLEGTGSLVLDRANRIAFACESARTNLDLCREWCNLFDYDLVTFHAVADGQPVYHTNVCMSVGTECAVVCTEWIIESDRARVLDALSATNHQLVGISDYEARAFCGNVLELSTANGPVLAGSWFMSPVADQSLRQRLAPFYSEIVGPDVPTIWSFGGGGLRCMICEIFLDPI